MTDFNQTRPGGNGADGTDRRPEVSIVMPSYNSERFIGEAIDSVLAQDFENFEILIIDDKSTDATRAIAQGYAAKDRRVRCLTNQRTKGAAGARNTGLDAARGEWITFLDSDDLLIKNCLSARLGFLVQNPDCRILSTDHSYVDETGEMMIDRRFSSNGLLDKAREWAVPVEGGFYLERPVEFFFDHFSLMWTGSVMIHASVIEQTGRFDETLTYGEDLKYWYQTALSNVVPTMESMAAGFGSGQTGTPRAGERIPIPPSTPSEATATRRQAGDTDNFLIHYRGRFYDRRLVPVTPDAVPSDGRVTLAIDPALSLVDAIAVRQRKVYFFDISTVYYRQHGASLTADTEAFLEGTEGIYREFLKDKIFSAYRTKASRRLALALNASSYHYRKKKMFLVATRLAARSILTEPSNRKSWRNLSATVLRVS